MSQETPALQRTSMGSVLWFRPRPWRSDTAAPQSKTTVPEVQWKVLAIAVTRALGLALPASFTLHLVGANAPNSGLHGVPFTPADIERQILAALAGAPVAVLAVGAIACGGCVLGQSLGRWNRHTIAECFDDLDFAIGLFSGAFAMPLGFVMLPHLATDAFGAWHAFVVAATTLGAAGGMLVAFLLVVLLMFWATAGV